MWYQTLDDARLRLSGTVILFDGKPVFIDAINYANDSDDIVLSGLSLPKFTPNEPISLHDPRWEAFDFPLGFMNTSYHAYYLSRRPVRRNRQGLSNDNMNATRADGQYGQHFRELIEDPGFCDMFSNTYPTVREAEVRLRATDAQSAAFHKTLALVKDPTGVLKLSYKGRLVGYGSPKEGFRIPSEFKYLRETLEAVEGVRVI